VSRYVVDKFLYQVDADSHLLERYMRDPEEFVPFWEDEYGPLVTRTERVTGNTFTSAERDALIGFDFETLYAMGAHPFILWTIMLPVLEHQLGSFPEASAHYTATIAKHGRPDWET
jgi:hypothetical protein